MLPQVYFHRSLFRVFGSCLKPERIKQKESCLIIFKQDSFSNRFPQNVFSKIRLDEFYQLNYYQFTANVLLCALGRRLSDFLSKNLPGFCLDNKEACCGCLHISSETLNSLNSIEPTFTAMTQSYISVFLSLFITRSR